MFCRALLGVEVSSWWLSGVAARVYVLPPSVVVMVERPCPSWLPVGITQLLVRGV